ncbi:class I SAM-dependent methyltransferase [Actinoalloteichus hymeniacidonis]|uniref:Methyltransferase domain n=1 Tax=Actinoalloteichus hymeniacidonis TaxID=340345 RepID=A0AAC9MYR1_9PSEU|nr:methyltransferase [Actinoalloteichus hymeniacidonis]AOS63570.1 Methyltransferase domain [Actinoalloteichus hymeniacidonis]MBB5908384.1 release factor glutamine methyltransferase [Actinoalloteichus hymeniacidonis]
MTRRADGSASDEQSRATAAHTADPAGAPEWFHALPATLSRAEILAVNQAKSEVHTWRRHEYNGWTFDVPPGVFLPGGTSRLMHDRLLDGTIELAGRSYAAMGAGLGVEAVIAGARGAREVAVLDVHPDSVRTAAEHYVRLTPVDAPTRFDARTSDLFDAIEPGTRFDVVTFNPPAVSLRTSDEPDVVRNVCVGRAIVDRFLDQLVERDLLTADGSAVLILSNTADLRGAIGYAIRLGLRVEVMHVQTWDDAVLTYFFRLRRPLP